MRRLLASCFIDRRDLFRCVDCKPNDHIRSRQMAGDAAALQADNALQQALRKKDAKAVGALLDKEFTWTNEAGKTRTGAQFLKDSAAGMPDGNTEYTDLKARDYGQTGDRHGYSANARTGGDTFFARIWVKRPAGWLLLTHQDTAIVAKSASHSAGARGRKWRDGSCPTAKILAAAFPTNRKRRNKKKSSKPIKLSRRRSLRTTPRPGPIT